MESGSGDFRRGDLARLEAAQREFDAQAQRLKQARARLRETREQSLKGRSEREILHDSAYARLQARLDTMPVIEQAKGILMAQQRCGPDEAFDLLRRASQRANVKVSVLAAQMVEQIASPVRAADAGRGAGRGVRGQAAERGGGLGRAATPGPT